MRIRWTALAAAVTTASLCAGAGATEFGQSHVDLGYVGILGGFAPPVGQLYLRADTNLVLSDRFNDRNGHPISANLGALGLYPIKFRSNTTAEVLSFAYVPDVVLPVLDARIGFAAYTYCAGARAEAQDRVAGRVSGSGETVSGLGDSTFIPIFINVAIPSTYLHVNVSPAEFTAPTGAYDRFDPIGASVGLGYFSYRPAVVTTYLDPQGLEIDLNTSLSFNRANGATHYKSGNEFGATFAVLQHVSQAFALGLEGYYYKQFTGDRRDGVEVNTVRPDGPFTAFDSLNQGPGNKGEVFAIGPAVAFNVTPTIATDIRFQHEIFSVNRRQGDVLWGKVSASF